MPTIIGTSGADIIEGSVGDDVIQGLAGSDHIDGQPGADDVDAGDGDDVVLGGAGDDIIHGGLGRDDLQGEAGNDHIYGGGDDDLITDREGDNFIDGGLGNDTIRVGSGTNFVFGGDGNDNLESDGAFGSSILDGGSGNDILNGSLGSQSDHLIGGAGIDYLGGNLFDFLDGGEGNDFFDANLGADADGGDGDDFIHVYISGFDPNEANITLGIGRDVLALNADFRFPLRPVIVTDFATGVEGDRFNFSDLTYHFIGWDGNSNPFELGYVRLVENGLNTLFQVDLDGAGDASDFSTLVEFIGVSAANLTSDHLAPGYAPVTANEDARNDFNGDGRSDIMFRHDNGAITNFLGTANGGILNNGDNVYSVVDNTWDLAGTGDFNGDGRDDVLWRNANGTIFNFLGTANGGVTNNGDNSFLQLNAGWTVSGIGDFNGDGRDDILFRDANGVIFDYLGTSSGGFTGNTSNLYTDIADAWHVSGVGDFNGDGRDDILFRNDNGAITNFLGTANGGILNNGDNIYTVVGDGWHVAGVGDFNGDGRDDILWRNDNGAIFNFLGTANGGVVNNGDNSFKAMDNAWFIAAIGDYNGDGRDDILWRLHDGDPQSDGTIMSMLGTASGGFTDNSANLFTQIAIEWQVVPPAVLI